MSQPPITIITGEGEPLYICTKEQALELFWENHYDDSEEVDPPDLPDSEQCYSSDEDWFTMT